MHDFNFLWNLTCQIWARYGTSFQKTNFVNKIVNGRIFNWKVYNINRLALAGGVRCEVWGNVGWGMKDVYLKLMVCKVSHRRKCYKISSKLLSPAPTDYIWYDKADILWIWYIHMGLQLGSSRQISVIVLLILTRTSNNPLIRLFLQ